MSEEQHLQHAYSSNADELAQRLEGVEAALRAAIRNDDDQEWLAWLRQRRDELKTRLAKEQEPCS